MDWDSLCVSPHGFQLRWKRPAKFRTAYAWWKRLLDTVGGGSRSDGLWHVVGKYRVRTGAPPASKLSDQEGSPAAPHTSQSEDSAASAEAQGSTPLGAPSWDNWRPGFDQCAECLASFGTPDLDSGSLGLGRCARDLAPL